MESKVNLLELHCLQKGGMYFVDRREAFADQIDHRRKLGLPDEPTARW